MNLIFSSGEEDSEILSGILSVSLASKMAFAILMNKYNKKSL